MCVCAGPRALPAMPWRHTASERGFSVHKPCSQTCETKHTNERRGVSAFEIPAFRPAPRCAGPRCLALCLRAGTRKYSRIIAWVTLLLGAASEVEFCSRDATRGSLRAALHRTGLSLGSRVARCVAWCENKITHRQGTFLLGACKLCKPQGRSPQDMHY